MARWRGEVARWRGEVARWRVDAATNACGAVAGEGKAPEVYELLSCCVPHRVRVAERDDGAAGSNMADGACGVVSGASRAEAGGGYRVLRATLNVCRACVRGVCASRYVGRCRER